MELLLEPLTAKGDMCVRDLDARKNVLSEKPLPVGQNSRPIPPPRPSSPLAQNIPLYRISELSHKRNTPVRDKGRIAIVTNRGLGSDGRDGVGARGVAGRETVSNRLFVHTTRR
ncbi:hypothetical protein QRQ56_04265 [Bradyrhizobium sp. U531]|uniref:hypothetical protein n=1 Tax=Bradyrhizobium sp. U531 TaxID=3053458 RepID=UPI003F426202